MGEVFINFNTETCSRKNQLNSPPFTKACRHLVLGAMQLAIYIPQAPTMCHILAPGLNQLGQPNSNLGFVT